METPSDPLLSRQQVLAILQCGRTTLWRREAAGLKFSNGKIRLSALRHWLEGQGAVIRPPEEKECPGDAKS
jgi:predicted DNA-binding transcriptional regulator AlpA